MDSNWIELPDSADPDGCRDIEEFDCTDNTCIAFGLTCNKETNCKAGQDEDKTMCKNRNVSYVSLFRNK